MLSRSHGVTWSRATGLHTKVGLTWLDLTWSTFLMRWREAGMWGRWGNSVRSKSSAPSVCWQCSPSDLIMSNLVWLQLFIPSQSDSVQTTPQEPPGGEIIVRPDTVRIHVRLRRHRGEILSLINRWLPASLLNVCIISLWNFTGRVGSWEMQGVPITMIACQWGFNYHFLGSLSSLAPNACWKLSQPQYVSENFLNCSVASPLNSSRQKQKRMSLSCHIRAICSFLSDNFCFSVRSFDKFTLQFYIYTLFIEIL